ncbi:MAG: autoinducer binding domain-containing protein [Hyphomonadaceae bacterium]|nr:autoinducer binding domain-containing protein [Hyphomonadaceae bacterium]
MSGRITPSAAFLADPVVSDPVLGFAETSYRATNVEELDATMADYLRRFDINAFVLCRATDAEKLPSAARIAGSSKREWRAHYDANGLAKSDGILGWGSGTAAPTTWMTFRQDQVAKGNTARIYDEASEFGLHDGFYLPIHQHDGSMLAVSMMASQKLPETRSTLAALHMLAVYYHLAAERLGLVHKPQPAALADRPALTKRQRECLNWVRAGKSSWEIGQILNLSEHTVNEHLQAARRRLGVRTTTQAVLEAAVRGLIAL